jgi:hypothetical protein
VSDVSAPVNLAGTESPMGGAQAPASATEIDGVRLAVMSGHSSRRRRAAKSKKAAAKKVAAKKAPTSEHAAEKAASTEGAGEPRDAQPRSDTSPASEANGAPGAAWSRTDRLAAGALAAMLAQIGLQIAGLNQGAVSSDHPLSHERPHLHPTDVAFAWYRVPLGAASYQWFDVHATPLFSELRPDGSWQWSFRPGAEKVPDPPDPDFPLPDPPSPLAVLIAALADLADRPEQAPAVVRLEGMSFDEATPSGVPIEVHVSFELLSSPYFINLALGQLDVLSTDRQNREVLERALNSSREGLPKPAELRELARALGLPAAATSGSTPISPPADSRTTEEPSPDSPEPTGGP